MKVGRAEVERSKDKMTGADPIDRIWGEVL
jgi:hypothetical protein